MNIFQSKSYQSHSNTGVKHYNIGLVVYVCAEEIANLRQWAIFRVVCRVLSIRIIIYLLNSVFKMSPKINILKNKQTVK